MPAQWQRRARGAVRLTGRDPLDAHQRGAGDHQRGIRLAAHVFKRVQKMPEDGRYVEMKQKWGQHIGQTLVLKDGMFSEIREAHALELVDDVLHQWFLDGHAQIHWSTPCW